jgi:ABC-2 type transport system permease protein
MNLVRAEWLKLHSVLSNKVLLWCALGAGIGLSVLVAAVVPVDQITDQLGRPPDQSDLFALAIAGLNTAQLLVAIVGVQVMAQEFRYTGRLTFAAEPHRTRVMVAKVVTLVAVGALVGLVTVALSLLAGGGVLSWRGLDLAVGGGSFWRAAVGGVVLTALYALVGLALGALVRSSALAIVPLVVWVLLVEPILAALVPRLGQYTPFVAGGQLQQVTPEEPGLGPWLGGGVLLAITVALLAAATVLLVRRDV